MIRLLLPYSVLLLLASSAFGQLVPQGSVWKYLDDGSDQGMAWQTPGFDDDPWSSGRAQLGYGDGDEATVVSFGPNPNQRFITTYFRHTFQVADPGAITFLNLRVLRDDGFVAYLNGTEVARNNLPGVVTYSTLASSTVSEAGENNFFAFFVDPALLVAGDNLLAVEIHQRSVASSDISFDLELTNETSAKVTRGPYLQMNTDSSIRIRWRTLLPVESVVEYGSSPTMLLQSASELTPKTEHELELTGLQPGTTYFYSVGSATEVYRGADDDHRFRTSPPAGTADPTRIWVLGDCGTANGNADRVRDAYYDKNGIAESHLILMLGDNAYPEGRDAQYQAGVFDTYPDILRRVPLWSTRGNHETVLSVYLDVFSFPTAGEVGGLPSGSESYYSFDYADIHFVCLDSQGSNRAPTGAMLTWLQSDLADTMQRWIIAFWHHPPYTKGSHDSDDNFDSGGRMRDMRQNALPILEDFGVDLVLSGHSHSYERSFLIDGHYGTSSTFDNSMLINGGDGRLTGDGEYIKTPDGHTGAVYCVAGSSGKLGGGSLDHPIMYASIGALGSVYIDVENDKLRAQFLDAGGVLGDFFTIHKEDTTPYLLTSRLEAGTPGRLQVTGAAVGNEVVFAYSLTGSGPRNSPYGMIDLSPPIFTIGPIPSDPRGLAQRIVQVPANASGRTVYLHAVELTGPGTGNLTNSLQKMVL